MTTLSAYRVSVTVNPKFEKRISQERKNRQAVALILLGRFDFRAEAAVFPFWTSTISHNQIAEVLRHCFRYDAATFLNLCVTGFPWTINKIAGQTEADRGKFTYGYSVVHELTDMRGGGERLGRSAD